MLSLGWSEPWRMRNLSFYAESRSGDSAKKQQKGKEEGIQRFQCEFCCIKKGLRGRNYK